MAYIIMFLLVKYNICKYTIYAINIFYVTVLKIFKFHTFIWLPYKISYITKSRYIAKFSSCTTTKVSIVLTSYVIKIKTNVRGFSCLFENVVTHLFLVILGNT